MYKLTKENAKYLDEAIIDIINKNLDNFCTALSYHDNNKNLTAEEKVIKYYRDNIINEIQHVMYSHAFKELNEFESSDFDLDSDICFNEKAALQANIKLNE